MILKNKEVNELIKYIKAEKKSVILFGAGVIGNTVIPNVFNDNNIIDKILYYVDNDKLKQGNNVTVFNKRFNIKSADVLKSINNENTIIIITISQFSAVLEQLDSIPELEGIETYIWPVMQVSFIKPSSKVIMDLKTQKIPKIIHYIWIGDNEIPDRLKKCVNSWKEFCPDYEIICWNEKNYDFSKNKYMKQAYNAKKWGFAPDYARLDILYNNGGIYLDTDVLLLKSLDDLLYQDAFASVEKWNIINPGGGIGSIKNGDAVLAMLEFRDEYDFINSDGSYNLLTTGFYDTWAMQKYGYKVNGEYQKVLGMSIYPYDYFHPYDYMSGTLQKSENTYGIHCFNGGWLDDNGKVERDSTYNNYTKILERMDKSK